MHRLSTYPTHIFYGFKLRLGRPYPAGATVVPDGINFSIASRHATHCTLVLFEKGNPQPMVEIPFCGNFERVGSREPLWGEFRLGNVFAIMVFDLDYHQIEYGFRMDGPGARVERGQPGFHRFNPEIILTDPYAKAIGGRDEWGVPTTPDDIYPHRARIMLDDFDWEGSQPPEIPMEDLVIYEMHVRGFTKHSSSKTQSPGTFSAIREKIPYLKELGVNCVELMPIYEFDELENPNFNPETGEQLKNYWGYSTIGFFAPKAGYAAEGKSKDGSRVADELKTLIKDLHNNGIEVILDVVFNHTAEGNEQGPTISFRGIDNVTYYLLTADGRYQNFSGTGNTLNCNNPIVRNLVLEALRYWVCEYHIDGFRFDLASILGRDTRGHPMANPPLIETMAYDPILGKCKLIAEAWDAGGLYQVGSFPDYGRWAEWNGKYRDDIRQFLRGDPGKTATVALRLQGSPDLYPKRDTTASINFITCHDGFTLADLFAYNNKHNHANGENNRDGGDWNDSWNCGYEGPVDDPGINDLRQRAMRNAIVILMMSQGVPMILMGDEIGRTQKGNNNTYCHDNELNWFDWELLQKTPGLFRFFKNMIAFRKTHPVLRNKKHLRHKDYVGSGYPDISWHGVKAWQHDFSHHHRTLAFMLCGKHAREGTVKDDYIYTVMNMHNGELAFELPRLPDDLVWHLFANTGLPSPEDCHEPGSEPLLVDQHRIVLSAFATGVLVSHPKCVPPCHVTAEETPTEVVTAFKEELAAKEILQIRMLEAQESLELDDWDYLPGG